MPALSTRRADQRQRNPQPRAAAAGHACAWPRPTGSATILPLRRAKSPPVNASFLQDGPRQLLQPAHGIALDAAEARRPAIALDRHALGDGRSLRQYA